MEIFPLKCSWFPWDRNPSKTELLEKEQEQYLVITLRATGQSLTSCSQLGYCLRTESHQQHHLRAQSRAWLPSRAITSQSCWRDTAMAHSSLVWKQLSKCLDTPFHQPSTTSPNPATPNTKVMFKWSPAWSPLPGGCQSAADQGSQEPPSNEGVNSSCTRFACELETPLSTKDEPEQFWCQPVEGTITHTNYSFCTCDRLP